MLCLLEVCISICPLPKPFFPASTWKVQRAPKSKQFGIEWELGYRSGRLNVSTCTDLLSCSTCLRTEQFDNVCVKSALPAVEVSLFSTDSANSLALEGQSWHDNRAEVDFSYKKVRQISRSKLKSGFISKCGKRVLFMMETGILNTLMQTFKGWILLFPPFTLLEWMDDVTHELKTEGCIILPIIYRLINQIWTPFITLHYTCYE